MTYLRAGIAQLISILYLTDVKVGKLKYQVLGIYFKTIHFELAMANV